MRRKEDKTLNVSNIEYKGKIYISYVELLKQINKDYVYYPKSSKNAGSDQK